MAFLEVKNLHKNYGETQVLKGVSFEMNKGEALSIAVIASDARSVPSADRTHAAPCTRR